MTMTEPVIVVQPVLARGSLDYKRRHSGLTIKTNFSMDSFPAYVDPFESSGETMTDDVSVPGIAHRLVEKLKGGEPERHPSPQPTHVSYPLMAKVNGNGHRVLRSATVGYVSPEFKGKTEQMKQGESISVAIVTYSTLTRGP